MCGMEKVSMAPELLLLTSDLLGVTSTGWNPAWHLQHPWQISQIFGLFAQDRTWQLEGRVLA